MLRVIDLTSFIGAYAARLFAEQGHEVIRVEPLEGDELRRLPPFLRDKQDLEHGAYHQFLNSGKKSVTVDVESDTGKKILHNLLGQAVVTVAGGLNRTESRGAHAREDFPDRDDQNWMKHTLAWLDTNTGKATIDYRPVHTNTMTNEVEYIPPKKRVY